jgi:site-specific DNA-cytosine methylase
VDTTQTTTHISLCAGYGGIDLGLKRAIPNLRTVAFSEIEAFACANLVSKMEAGILDPAPVWTDLKTFPWESFRGKVDILSGGYPCQPFSSAGKRLGKDDPRHLWPYIADGIRILQPALCFFENVEGHITLGLRDVLDDLGRLGYRTSWGIFSASEVGAPHQRKRLFILAHRADLESQVRYIAEFLGPVAPACLSSDGSRQGSLNPRWVETLMGLPVGWTMPSCASPVTIASTNCDSSATELSQPPQPELF